MVDLAGVAAQCWRTLLGALMGRTYSLLPQSVFIFSIDNRRYDIHYI